MSNEFKLVPVEPTEEMCRAGLAERHDELAKSIYKSMLAAASQPPAIGGEPEVLCAAACADQLRQRITFLTSEVHARASERDQLKARCDQLEVHKIVLKFGLRSIEGYKGRTTVGELKSMAKVTADRVEQLEAALSKPAGSEQV